MWNSIFALLLGLFAEVAPWDPASLNPMPVRVSRQASLPAEPSTFVLALIGVAIFALFAGVQRWRRAQSMKSAGELPTRKSASEPRKRDAA